MSKQFNPALIVIDIQNDYFSGGSFPLWNYDQTLENVESAIVSAKKQGIHVVLVQHVANSKKGTAPFFNEGSEGVEIHPRIRAVAADAPIIIKHFADSFHQTNLASLLSQLDVNELWVCGMMTQNCVTHTAISKSAEAYKVSILADCCTTVSQMLHGIALNAVSTRLELTSSAECLGAGD